MHYMYEFKFFKSVCTTLLLLSSYVLTCTEYVCSSALLDVLKPARAVRTCTEYVCSSALSDVLKPARAVRM